MKRLLALALALPLAQVTSVVYATPQVPSRTIWDGVYAAGQADQGQRDYVQLCGSCHGADLSGRQGGAPALVGPAFFERWHDLSVFDLFFAAQGEMDQASSPLDFDFKYVSPERFRDIVSYLLRENGAPAGKELPTDFEQLRQVQIVPKANK